MKEYETVYITRPNLTDSQLTQLNEKVQALVEKHKGRFFFARSMGKRKLAYPIAKETKGIYYCIDYAGGGDIVSDLERMFRLNEDVIRFLTVTKNDDVDVEARASEIAVRGEDASQDIAEESAGEGRKSEEDFEEKSEEQPE